MENRKFNVGDIVVGNALARMYSITKPGFVGKVVSVRYSLFEIESLDGRTGPYDVSYDAFDLYVDPVKTHNVEDASVEPIVCSCCGRVIEDGEYFEFDSHTMCNDCRETELTVCVHCGKTIWKEDSKEFDGKTWCEDCFDDNVYECDRCGDYAYYYDMYSTSSGDRVCECCQEEYYVYCFDCDELIDREYAYFSRDGRAYCESCWEDHRERAIMNYSAKPYPIFYGGDNENALYMGVELEIDKGGEDDDNAEAILDVANGNHEHVYAKHDGSLNDGFEIVSHPATLEYHTENIAWQKTMEKALSMEYRSHDTSTCGLHVHVSRKALGLDDDEREKTIARIIFFTELHWNEILKFTRRTADRMERWAQRYGIIENTEKTYKNAKGSYERYRCINLQNDATVEFRMFRGTLRYKTFIATLQFVDELCRFCVDNTDKTIETTAWTDFVTRINGDKKPELVEYLKERKLYTNDNDDENADGGF